MNHRNSFKHIRNKMNKNVRAYNVILASDTLFPDRFYIREVGYSCFPYEDGSGAEMRVRYRVFDKVTGNTGDFIVDNYSFPWQTFQYVNDFVIRSRDGCPGHFPPLNWVALDIRSVKE